MDAVRFIEERNRMCGTMSEMWGVDAAQIVKNTEEWSAAHPRKTRQSEFLKQWPETALMQDGVITICPLMISAAYRDKNGACNKDQSDTCADCKRQFWLAEVEE